MREPTERREPSNRRILSVSEIARSARVLLEERFALVWVEGEVSNLRRPGSGHWYFTLKDERAQLKCAMFASRNRFVRAPIADGARIVVRGRLSLYEPRGDFQLLADHIEVSGEGELRAAFEALKTKLAAEGLFAVERKRDLPRLPRHLAIVTSPAAAALRDVLTVLRRRCPVLQVTVLPVAVQGPDAQRSIVNALKRLARWPKHIGRAAPDVVLVTRGGGSLEDLFAFNLEPVARAIAACPIPIVSAIGHETDVTIADFVADLRAPTPSAAAELIAPDLAAHLYQLLRCERTLAAHTERTLAAMRRHVTALSSRLVSPARLVQMRMQRADELERTLHAATRRRLERDRMRLVHLRQRLLQQHPRRELARHADVLSAVRARARRAVVRAVEIARARLEPTARALNAVSPLPTLARGYAVLARPAPGSRWGSPLTRARDAAGGERLIAHLQDGRLELTVDDVDADAD
jgi:exodeoxyribonuclease VII large subunit